MIEHVDSSALKTLAGFCRQNPFGCKISSLAQAYGTEVSFAEFWLQYHDNQVTAAISRFENAAVLYAADTADISELHSFLSLLGISVLQCEESIGSKIGQPAAAGAIMHLAKQQNEFVQAAKSPSLRDIYNLLQSCENPGFSVPPFTPFYVDMSHRIRHGAARSVGIYRQDILVSCAMTVAQTEESAVIGAVATRPEYQNQGYGTKVVTALTSWLQNEQDEYKEIYLLRAAGENKKFYEQLGFADCGGWNEINYSQL